MHRRASSRETAKRIKEVALRLFLEKGYSDVSLEEVASLVGITKPAIYIYYRSKAELFKAAMEELFSDMTSMVESVVSGKGSVVERFERLADVLVARFSEMKRLYGGGVSEPFLRRKMVLRRWGRGSGEDSAFFHRLRENFLKKVEALFEEGASSGIFKRGLKIRFLARSFVSMCAVCAMEDCSKETDTNPVVEVFLEGILSEGS